MDHQLPPAIPVAAAAVVAALLSGSPSSSETSTEINLRENEINILVNLFRIRLKNIVVYGITIFPLEVISVRKVGNNHKYNSQFNRDAP